MALFGGLFGGNNQGSQSGMQSALLQMIADQQNQQVLNNQYGQAKGEYATDYYTPYTSAGNSALAMYLNGLGLNGQEGNSAALGAFQKGPGYDWQMGQGVQALDRSAAGKGMYGSGNNAMALTQYGQGLANQTWNDWMNRLAQQSQMGMSAAGGETGRQGALAGIDTGLGNQIASSHSQAARGAADAMYQGQMADAASNAQGGSNLFSALLGGANLGGRFLSGGFGSMFR